MKTDLSKLIFIILFSCAVLTNSAQSNLYEPQEIDSISDVIENFHENFLDNIEGEESRKIKKFYKNLDESLIKGLKDKRYWFDPKTSNKLDQILEVVYSSNPDLHKDKHLWLVSNSAFPNAGCYGNGIFTVNAGLFLTQLSEGEIAFIVCHELAHLILNHSLEKISNHVVKINSKEVKEKISSAKRKRYGSTRAGLLIYDELRVDLLEHSKAMESEADSIGLELFEKTPYNVAYATNSLARLRDYKERLKKKPLLLDTVFNSAGYKFKPFWTKKETSLFSTDDINDYSLKSDTIETHPGISSRVDKMITATKIVDSLVFNDKLPSVDFSIEILEKSINSGHIDVALEMIIHYKDSQFITDRQYRSLFSKILEKTRTLKQDHELSKYVSVYDEFSEFYRLNEIRNVLHNISEKNLKKLLEAYNKQFNL
ncbi:MAG: M48 family metalloprotease [Nonlabens sp.]